MRGTFIIGVVGARAGGFSLSVSYDDNSVEIY